MEELGLAYRKAKVDLYYSTQCSLLKIASYEENLHENLERLLIQLNGENDGWVNEPSFLGGWTLAPKSIDVQEMRSGSVVRGLVVACPSEDWDAMTGGGNEPPEAEFRLMAECSMDFHVLSALWIMKVGAEYDGKLTGSAYGSRLRRCTTGKFNELSLGSFQPYLRPFREWRDGGIKAMKSALDAKKRIVALTADVSSFYHELDPGFMLEKAFLELLGLELSPQQSKLNRLFIHALMAWAKNTPLKRGLPVGLPASALVANMALIELDRLIEGQAAPLYYGRYVDDILLVMEDVADFRSAEQLWDWLFVRAGGRLGWDTESAGADRTVRFRPAYLATSNILFKNKKNKVFLLSGSSGETLIRAISEQIYLRASEWRSMPDLPLSPDHIATDILAATNRDGEPADNLRKTDALTMYRAGFALKLRDYEAYERDLHPDAWKSHRHAFLDAVIEHLLTPQKYFELAQYFSRIVRLAVACEDFEHLRRIIDKFRALYQCVERDCKPVIKGDAGLEDAISIVSKWLLQVERDYFESILAAFPPVLSRKGRAAWDVHMAGIQPSDPAFAFIWPLSVKGIQTQHARLFSHDLAHLPLRFIGLPKEMIAQRGIPKKGGLTVLVGGERLLPDGIWKGIDILSGWTELSKKLPPGLPFATRPFNLSELYIVAKSPFAAEGLENLRHVVKAVRGFELSAKAPRWIKERILEVSDNGPKNQQTVAVSSWRTDPDSWVASVMRRPDPDGTRYRRLNQLINGVISQPDGASYFILPELSLPAHWFMRISQKLKGRGISLIAGIEYMHARKKRVRNQVWAALTHDGLGFPSLLVYRQDKQAPALQEERDLYQFAGLTMQPESPWKADQPPVIQHGDFQFALMVCSELTNIRYRASLRGKVDALFVPEWNRDTESFNALVESSALDVHAYVVQCNDRNYGDSRIRAPYKDSWRRDILRVKGGIHDYCVTGRIDIKSLRQFQSSYRSPGGPFKPVPDGFRIDPHRVRLPDSGSTSNS
jgi:hypothetical protein